MFQSERTVIPVLHNDQNVTFEAVKRERSRRNYNKDIFKTSDEEQEEGREKEEEETGGAG